MSVTKTSLKTSDLAQAISSIRGFVAPRSPNESYGKISIQGLGSSVNIRAANTYGVVAVVIPASGILEECFVDWKSFSAVIRRLGESTSIYRDKNNLILKSGSTRVSVPLFAIGPRHLESVDNATASAEVLPDDLTRAFRQMSWIQDPSVIRVADAIRLVTEDQLHLIGRHSTGWACAALPASGDALDALVPYEAMDAVVAAMKCAGDTVTLHCGDGWFAADSEGMACYCNLAGGKPHLLAADVAKMIEGYDAWNVSRDDMLSFLSMAEVFIVDGASGVWLVPCEDGLQASYAGDSTEAGVLTEASGRCATLVSGEASGRRAFVSHHKFAPAVKASTEVDFMLAQKHTEKSAMVMVASENYMAIISQLQEPPSAEETP